MGTRTPCRSPPGQTSGQWSGSLPQWCQRRFGISTTSTSAPSGRVVSRSTMAVLPVRFLTCQGNTPFRVVAWRCTPDWLLDVGVRLGEDAAQVSAPALSSEASSASKPPVRRLRARVAAGARRRSMSVRRRRRRGTARDNTGSAARSAPGRTVSPALDIRPVVCLLSPNRIALRHIM